MKKGFTLIEIMVVIIIMGILAAIAVPKISSLIAKAKASEIHTAAGTYVHLQEAYLVTKNGPGSWSDIGYGAPGNGTTRSFCYNQGTLTESVNIADIQENTIGWGAASLSNMNECPTSSWWSIIIVPQGDKDVRYVHNVSSSECQLLTSSWSIGTTMTGDCESTAVAQKEPTEQPEKTEEPTNETPEENPENPTTNEPEDQSEKTPTFTPEQQDIQHTFGECTKAHGDNWLNGEKNGQAWKGCMDYRDGLIESGDLQKNNGNTYDFVDEEARCRVTGSCTDEEYASALAEKKKAEEAAKKTEDEAKNQVTEDETGDNNNQGDGNNNLGKDNNDQSENNNTNLGGDNNQSGNNNTTDEGQVLTTCKDNKNNPCDCSKGGNCKPVKGK